MITEAQREEAVKIYYAKLLAAKKSVPLGKTYDDVVNEAYQEYLEALREASGRIEELKGNSKSGARLEKTIKTRSVYMGDKLPAWM